MLLSSPNWKEQTVSVSDTIDFWFACLVSFFALFHIRPLKLYVRCRCYQIQRCCVISYASVHLCYLSLFVCQLTRDLHCFKFTVCFTIVSKYFCASRNSSFYIDRRGANVSILVKVFYGGRLRPPLLRANMQFPLITLEYENLQLLFVNTAFLREVTYLHRKNSHQMFRQPRYESMFLCVALVC